MKPGDKSILHSVLHVCAAAMIVTQLVVIGAMRKDRDEMMGSLRDAEQIIHEILRAAIVESHVYAVPSKPPAKAHPDLGVEQ